MKRNKSNERQRRKQADNIRRMEIEQMSERKPLSKAMDAFKRPAYQARSMSIWRRNMTLKGRC